MTPVSPNPPRRSAPSRPTTLRPPDRVDPRWLLQAGAVVAALGLFCAYLTVCALFYTQQWQFVLHPTRTVTRTPAAEGLQFQPIRFGDDGSGEPQLNGWWIPSQLPTDPTVLMLHREDGNMGDALAAARELHDARLNVLLFDPRGYGGSGGRHPTEQLMQADARSALFYLTQTRGIRPASIVVYGAGLGASLAVRLCSEFQAIPAVILQSANGDTESRVLRDNRAHIVPVRLLFHERFPLADPLHRLRTPKLLISFTEDPAPVDARRAGDPKMTVELPRSSPPAELTRIFHRFIGNYVPEPPPLLKP